jgi:DNA modification methylase
VKRRAVKYIRGGGYNYMETNRMKTAVEHEVICPICHIYKDNHLGDHIHNEHGEKSFRQGVLDAKKSGMPDPRIGEVFGITFRQLEKIITDAYGINISVLKKSKKITHWMPKNFKEETTTVWSYKQRGNWATHDGRYRGNWSPYIPRNVILKYSEPGDVVLDYFAGGGTTAVEAKLLGRKCIAKDINPACVTLTKENLHFTLPKTLFGEYPIFEPVVNVGDARNLSEIEDDCVDLICAHPPYAGIINYSSKVDGDLSQLSIEEFLIEMGKVAQESYRVLKPGRKCAILIGDTRKRRHVIPIGFQTIKVFLDAGFKLKELVIKRQHNCKTTGFWTEKSIKNNFLLLAHEYLPIFEKSNKGVNNSASDSSSSRTGLIVKSLKPIISKDHELETTCVWLFPSNDYEKHLDSNVIRRYSGGNNYWALSIDIENPQEKPTHHIVTGTKDLVFIRSLSLKAELPDKMITSYLRLLKDVVDENLKNVTRGGFIVIHTRDVRVNGYIEPLGKKIVELLTSNVLWLKEIVVVSQNGQKKDENKYVANENLEITHRYLLVYEVVE